jgi:hypothetical protein
MKLIAIILSFLLAAGAMAQDSTPPPVAAEFGVLVSQNAQPAFAYAVNSHIGVRKLVGPLVHKLEFSALYSDRGWDKAEELYVVRASAVREIHWKKAYLGLGAGTWAFMNSDGEDLARASWKTEIGYRTGGLDAKLGGEIVSFEGPDLYFLYAGLAIGI